MKMAIWEKWEDISADKVTALSAEEQVCEDLFVSTVSRGDGCRFIVRLPFRERKTEYNEDRIQ